MSLTVSAAACDQHMTLNTGRDPGPCMKTNVQRQTQELVLGFLLFLYATLYLLKKNTYQTHCFPPGTNFNTDLSQTQSFNPQGG